MKRIYYFFVFVSLIASCKQVQNTPVHTPEGARTHDFTKVLIENIHTDSTSIRAVAVGHKGVMYAGSDGHYGYAALGKTIKTRSGDVLPSIFTENGTGVVSYKGKQPAFRSIASTTDYYYVLSIESPALLYRITKETGAIVLVYTEDHENVFYDAMTFWNDKEGIAMGDPTGSCLSIVLTRDGGKTWHKIPCERLPKSAAGEAAFAASDTNIKTIGDNVWIVSGGMKSRILCSPDKGATWEIYETPMVQGSPTSGAYTMDFYDSQNGIIYGGDYTAPEANEHNIAVTSDGGKTWQTIASGSNQGYKSCVQYVPNSNGQELIALGFTGISYSKDAGLSWQELSKESFLSFRFLNDSVAYAGGRNRFARLTFR